MGEHLKSQKGENQHIISGARHKRENFGIMSGRHRNNSSINECVWKLLRRKGWAWFENEGCEGGGENRYDRAGRKTAIYEGEEEDM